MDEVTEIDAIVWNQDNKHYRDMSDDTLDRIIKTELNNIKKTFVSIGFFLRVADEKRIYEKKGYKTLWAYAYDTYGISRSYASRYMQINRRFSKGGSSTILDEKYQDFGKSQLQEMIALPDDKLEEVTPDMKVLAIRHLNPKSKSKPEPDPEPEEMPAEDIPGQMVIEDYPEVMPEEQPVEENTLEPCAMSHKTEEVEAPHFTLDGENGERLAGWDYCEIVKAYVLAKDGWKSDMGIARIPVYAYEYTAVKSPAKKIVKFYNSDGILDFTADYDLLDKQYEFQTKREEMLRERERVPEPEETEEEIIEEEPADPAPDVPEAKSKTEWPEVLAGMPQYGKLAIKDYLNEAERELKEYVTLDEEQKDERLKIPAWTMAREYMQVEGLRLLLALVEKMEEEDE